MASRNGTFVDGRRIHAPTEVRDGAIIGIGPIALTFTAVAPPASTRPVNGARADRPPSGGPT
jgi:pSer/pThr/pTyr-binding forkhead associated (FHA) protein